MSKSRDTQRISPYTIGCFVALAGMVMLYLYFLNMSVVEVVLRSEHAHTERSLQAEIAELESEYIAAQHKIAARMSTLDGYTVDTSKFFVSREQASLVLRDQ